MLREVREVSRLRLVGRSRLQVRKVGKGVCLGAAQKIQLNSLESQGILVPWYNPTRNAECSFPRVSSSNLHEFSAPAHTPSVFSISAQFGS